VARPTEEAIADAIETLGGLVSDAGGEGDDALDVVKDAVRLPELFGTAAAAEVLGTTPANMQRWRSLPAPLYDLPAGRFYDADAIRELAARRAEGAAA
jgi:hypothetical protein